MSLQNETYSVSALCEEVRELLQTSYSHVWVAGEVNRVRQHRSGHLYFELIEKGGEDRIVGKLEAVAWRNDFLSIRRLLAESGQELREGQEIRCRASLDFYPPFGRLQLVVREVDPVFTLGLLAQRRQETLAALARGDLLERNARLHLESVPLEIGLVTSHESAAYHDFLSSLHDSDFGFRVLFVHAAVQGREAEGQIEAALRFLGRQNVDCLALIRGGGSRADLAVFDSRRIAQAIAHCPVPVLTGLGHEIDRAIADMTAHTAFKTPTKVAEFLVERVAQAERAVNERSRAFGQISRAILNRGREFLRRSERGLMAARYCLASARFDLRRLVERLPRSTSAALRSHRRRLKEMPIRAVAASALNLERSRRRPELALERIGTRAAARLCALSARLAGIDRLCVQLSPTRTLERGFSITRDVRGRALTHSGSVTAGDPILSQLARGTIRSRVEET